MDVGAVKGMLRMRPMTNIIHGITYLDPRARPLSRFRAKLWTHAQTRGRHTLLDAQHIPQRKQRPCYIVHANSKLTVKRRGEEAERAHCSGVEFHVLGEVVVGELELVEVAVISEQLQERRAEAAARLMVSSLEYL